jgi:predicted nuclease of predicted toxin-antitoxin system
MRIKLDENLPAELADELRRLGHLVDTVADEGLEGQSDPQVADAARRGRRCLFSLDKGLGDIRRYPPKTYYGIVLFRFRRVGRISVRRGVLALLPEIERRQPLKKLLLVASDSGIRVRR